MTIKEIIFASVPGIQRACLILGCGDMYSFFVVLHLAEKLVLKRNTLWGESVRDGVKFWW